jgi:hypothetical protein
MKPSNLGGGPHSTLIEIGTEKVGGNLLLDFHTEEFEGKE